MQSKDDAFALEQRLIDQLHNDGRLINSSLNGRSPIDVLNGDVEAVKRRNEGSRRWRIENAELVKETARRVCAQRWSDPEARTRWSGGGNPFSKKIKVDDITYPSVKDAERALGINEKTLRKRAHDPNQPNYTFDVKDAR